MPLWIAGVLFVAAVLLPLMAISLVQRYRVGTSRQRARGWLATVNLAGVSLSAAVFLAGAAMTTAWVPGALTYSVAGLLCGVLLGLAGLRLTRWERGAGVLHYTPNRWLVLGIVLLVTARIAYGLWRTWTGVPSIAGSLAAGALVLGYYLAYWFGVRRRLKSS